ncbi:MAG: hypothetical protein KGJ78_11355 [Alphaproteobacteria bacterium]|nr:hypothetical protein [Alphaproteobacteria bacterium]
MSKLGVGVGQDFPVGDAPKEQSTHGEGCCGAESSGDRYEAWRRWQEQKRYWRQMRADWRARRAAMREQFRREVCGEDDDVRRHHRVVHGVVLGALAVIGLAALFGHHHDHS